MVPLKARQAVVPTANGISAVGVTVQQAAPSVTGLALDDGGSGSGGGSLSPTDAPVAPPLASSLPAPAVPSAATGGSGNNNNTSADNKETFSTGMVVGICIGAFVGALAIIALGVMIYRKSAPKPGRGQQRRRGPPPPLSSDNARRRSSGLEWTQFNGGKDPEDQWEGKYPPAQETKQVTPNSIGPMFKKSASLHSGYTHKSSDEALSSNNHSFGQYHPELARELGTEQVSDAPTTTNKSPFLSRVDTGPALSWDSSGMSFKSNAEAGRMSPIANFAIPTPPAMSSHLQHAQSAEVIDYEGQTAEIVNPFLSGPPPGAGRDEGDGAMLHRRKSSAGNPFFGSRSDSEAVAHRRTRSRAHSTVSAASSHYTDYVPSHIDKGKARALDLSSHGHGDDDMYATDEEDLDGYYSAASGNPFVDPVTTTPKAHHQVPLPPPSEHHPYAAPIFQTTPPSPRRLPATPSPTPSTPVNDQNAIEGLLAAMDIGDGVKQEGGPRTTGASVGSNYSEDVEAAQFPQPPYGRR